MKDIDDSHLTDKQKKVLRDGATEAPGTGPLLDNKDDGTYRCAACDAKLFESDAKFDSGSGWPSFDQAIDGAIDYKDDDSMFMKRTEVLCSNCGGHLGHVFNDGPRDTTGKRYCINSCSLDFEDGDGSRRSGAANESS